MRRIAGCVALFAVSALAQAPDPEQLFRQAVDAQQRGDDAAAIRDYQQLIERQPGFVGALANLGAAFAHSGHFDDAIREYQAALKLEPENASIRLNLGLSFYKKNDFAGAAREFETLRAGEPGNLQTATLLGDCYLKLNRASAAVALTGPLASAHPEDQDLAYVYAAALINNGKRRDGATAMDQVARATSGADGYLLAGSTWLELNEFEKARADLDAAEKLNPDLGSIHTLVGIARDGVGDAAGAEPELRKALELDPKDFRANLYLGAILYKRRDLVSAGPFLERAMSLSPDSELARYQHALYESATGKLEPAAADLEALVRKNPEWLQPHVELAALYYKLHRPADGAKERAAVDRLSEQQQSRGPQ